VILLPNTTLGVRHRGPGGVDTHGMPTPGTLGPVTGPWPGLAIEHGDGTWTLGLPPAAAPVREHDLVVELVGVDDRTWLVITAELRVNPAGPVADWVRVEAREHVTGGTEPGGPQFAAGGTG
jgi:hypothetical protein